MARVTAKADTGSDAQQASRAIGREIDLRTSPHQRTTVTVDVIMRNVVLALLPVCAFAVYNFGLSALALIVVTTVVAVATEHLFCKLSGRASTVGDWSAVITGILLALTLPPAFPLWMAVVAAVVAIGIGKAFFGGLGYNPMNPALVGRAFAQAAFTLPMTTWTPALVPGRFAGFIPSTLTIPFLEPVSNSEWLARSVPDAFTGATPLALMKFDQIPTDSMQLLIGTVSGSTGETAALLILVCGLYLVFRKMMNWRIPVSILLTAGLLSGIFHQLNPEIYPDPWFTLFSGGLMLGAVFMASDMVGSPETRLGVWVYGALIGALVIIIRFFGGLNEGVMYAILFGNAAAPLISRVTQPRKYGAVKKRSTAQ